MMNKVVSIILLTAVFIGAFDAQAAPADDVKYIVFNRMPEKDFYQHHPYTINMAGFLEVTEPFKNLPPSRLKPGLCFVFSYLKSDVETVKLSLERFLYFSQRTQTPVMVKLDGEQWWQNRPDLWNWWDPQMPGFNPDNRNNVEWRWWGPEYALKIAWRNWGAQLRVLPPPNLMSPAYRKACHDAMDVLMPVVLNWYNALPEDQKYLLIGLNLGWESSIGINAFYYPNGNDLIDQPEPNDPKSGANREDPLSRGVVQQGYAAVKTAGIRQSGDICEEDLYTVVKMHLDDLCKRAHDRGFPRDKVITHGWGNEKGERMFDAAVNPYSCPGWSEYWYAHDPSQNNGIVRNIENSDAPYWAAVEWLLVGSQETGRWKDALLTTLNYRNCKLVCVFNWEGIRESPEVIEAVRQVIREYEIK